MAQTKNSVSLGLIKTNLPLTLSDVSDKYDNSIENSKSVMDRFFITKNELPDEVEIIERISLDDYPESKAKKQIYVSVKSGDDSNSGSKESPLKSINAALDKMKNECGGVIWIEGGEYKIKEPILVDKSHAGSEKSPLFIIGYGDERVKINSNKIIDSKNFKKIDPINDPVAARIPDRAKDKVVCANLYELGFERSDIADVTRKGNSTLFVGNDEFTLARYPNAYYEDGTPINIRDLLYFRHVYDAGSVEVMECLNYHPWLERVNKPGSGLTPDSVLGWEIQLLDERHPEVDKGDNAMRDEVLSWVNTGDIWYYGSVYSGWEFAYYRLDKNCVHDGNLLGTLKDDGFYSLKSEHPCICGALPDYNSAAGRNTFFLFNAIEALDAPGEWFIDKETGMLYIYPKTDDISKQEIVYTGSDSMVNMQFVDTKFVVVDNIHVDGSGGTGFHTFGCDNIVMQNVSAKNTRYNGMLVQNTYNSAVIYSEFSHSRDSSMVSISNVPSRDELKPCNVFFQNNFVHDTSPTNAYGLGVRACRAVIAHNLFLDACMTNAGEENIIEYNEFSGGNKYVTDGGMVYMFSFHNRGHHVRYNLFHKFNATHNAVYNDGKSSGIYSYGNIVSTVDSKSNYNKGWYSSSGHGNVCYASIMVFRDIETVARAKGLDADEQSGLIKTGDTINQSGLFYYYYGDGAEGNSEAGHWWKGHRETEINYRLSNPETVIKLKKRYPDYMANITRIKLILAAYDVGYMPTYDPQPLSGKEFVYTDAKDGEKLYIPAYDYIDASGNVATMPSRTLTAENGKGFTVTYDEVAAMERLERQPAFAFINNNLVLGGLRPTDTIDDVITNDVEVYKGFIRGESAVGNNYYQFDYTDIMPGIKNYDYTISDSAWEKLTKEMGPEYVEILCKLDYKRAGILK